MNPRRVLRNALLLFAGGSLAVFAVRELDRSELAGPDTEDPPPASGVVVYYLSQGKDCTVCNNIEAYTLETLETHFSAQLASGEIIWRSLDVDEPRYAHFVTDFKLYTKAVVFAEMRDAQVQRWKNLEAIWEEVYDKEGFIAYIQRELQTFLETPA